MSYDRILAALERRRGDVRAVVDELEELLVRVPPDEHTRRAIKGALDRRGVRVRGIDSTWRPGVGESYVLLVGASGGSVGRIAVRRAGPPYRIQTENLGARAAEQAVVALDALGRRLAVRGRGVPDADARGHLLVCLEGEIDGASLGVAFAAAAVSSWTGRPPHPDAAATAALHANGDLVAVCGLEAKLIALADAYPVVRRVVVAREQGLVSAPSGISLVPCATIDEALEALGFTLDEITASLASASDVESQIARLAFEQVEDYSAERWREHALRARLLAGHRELPPSEAVKASAFAALFHLHAGDAGEAERLAAAIPDESVDDLPAEARAWVWITRATSAIDAGREDAVALAQRAVDETVALRSAEARPVRGRALGTLGRAKMHAGDDADALPLLEEGGGVPSPVAAARGAAIDDHDGDCAPAARST